MSWTEDRVAVLRQLWGNGKSASEIAEILGGVWTRNAVIGKAHRLGLSGRPSPIRKGSTQPARHAFRSKPRPRAKTVGRLAIADHLQTPPSFLVHNAPSRRPDPRRRRCESSAYSAVATIFDLTERMCR